MLLMLLSEHDPDPGRLWQDIQEQLGGYLREAFDESERQRDSAVGLARMTTPMLEAVQRLRDTQQAGDTLRADQERQEVDRLTAEVTHVQRQFQVEPLPFPTALQLIEMLRTPR